MNSRAVQVRLSLEGGKQVESELVSIGQRGQAAMGQLERGMQGVARTSGASKAAIQNTAFQIGDMAVQMGAGTSATRAMAMQLPQLLGGFGPVGAVVGTVTAVVLALAVGMSKAEDATAKLVDEMMSAGGTASSVESAIGAVRDVAEGYAEAIHKSGGASSAAAALVVANSRKEFEARKEVLAVEIELMRIRGAERAANISALQGQVDVMRTGMMTDVGQMAGMRGQSREAAGMTSQLPANLAAGFNSVTNAPVMDSWMSGQVQTLLALRKLNAEGTLDDLALQKAEEIFATEFANIDVAAAASAAGKKAGGGRTKKPEKVVKEGVDAMVAELMEFQKKAADIGSEIGSAITSGFSAAEDAVANFVKTGKFEIGDLVSSMMADFAKLATQHFITGPLAGLVGSALSGIGGGFGKTLSGALTSFDGGGWTGGGARSGGLDGRGGFLAMLHPQEKVVDYARGQREGGIVMNVYARDAQSFAQSRTQVASAAARMLMAARRGM